MSQHLKFEHEKGATRSKYVAGALVLLIVGWMGSGMVMPAEEEQATEPTPAETAATPIAVAVEQSASKAVPEVFTAEGQTATDRESAVRAETGGTIAEVLVTKGDMVSEGQVLARIDAAQRTADLRRAELAQERAARELANAETLLERGVSTNDRVVGARSDLAAAEAGLANAREAMGNLEITAAFGGRLESLNIEAGEFIGAGTEVARVVDLDPLLVTFQVPQQAVSQLKVGQPAQIDFVTGTSKQGTLKFLSSAANAQTRTFTAEVEVPNADLAVPAGISAEVFIPTGESRAHFISPAILSLNTDGALGVKAVGDENIVAFYPVEIIRAETNGVWVAGLPEELTLITIGQGYVNAGEVVDPRAEDEMDATSEPKETDE